MLKHFLTLQIATQVDTMHVEQLDHIQSSVDSILYKVSPTPIFDGVDFYISSVTDFWISVIAVFISVLAALFGFLGYWSQRKTTMNTSKVSISSQKAQFINITRHLYRNLVCTIAVYESYRNEIEIGGKRFPSEEHLLKLQFSPEDVVHIEKYLNDEKIYALMNQFKMLVRNYNVEIDVTLNHLKDESIERATVYHDFQTLIFKPLFLISKMIDIEAKIDETANKYAYQDREYLVHRAAAIILESHIGSVFDKQNVKKIDWGKYAYKDYVIDEQYDSARAFNILFKGHNIMEKSDLLGCYEWENEDKLTKYLSEDVSLSKLWNVTADSPLHQIISGDKFDVNKFFSIVLSVDSSLEKSVLNFIGINT